MIGEQEIDDLAALWQEEPSPVDQENFEGLAAKVRRRARIGQYLEIGFGLFLLLLLAAGLFLTPSTAALVVGAGFAGILSWSAWRRYRLNRIAILVHTGDREVVIESLIKGTEARIRRSHINMALALPGYLLGGMAQYAIMNGNLSGFPSFIAQRTLPISPGGIAATLLMGGLFAYLGRYHGRLRSELARLRALHREYRAERQFENRI
ncbi:hypothetical protein IC614_01525 [Allosphingosinicella flava]|uniref:Uncharacterized protein n=1 Tax=Allosphingosinicella flava TaxID=2771430 RepID=A0A7T2GK27_9SPHN|nr:hypothetical protein [Sphingosinicella flava]QPQ55320.1 hypothetical protein IC614_01525 [Sphingosinicella flava]